MVRQCSIIEITSVVAEFYFCPPCPIRLMLKSFFFSQGTVWFLRCRLSWDLPVFPSYVYIRPLWLSLGFSTLTQPQTSVSPGDYIHRWWMSSSILTIPKGQSGNIKGVLRSPQVVTSRGSHTLSKHRNVMKMRVSMLVNDWNRKKMVRSSIIHHECIFSETSKTILVPLLLSYQAY